jgi:hypothetical protein
VRNAAFTYAHRHEEDRTRQDRDGRRRFGLRQAPVGLPRRSLEQLRKTEGAEGITKAFEMSAPLTRNNDDRAESRAVPTPRIGPRRAARPDARRPLRSATRSATTRTTPANCKPPQRAGRLRCGTGG